MQLFSTAPMLYPNNFLKRHTVFWVHWCHHALVYHNPTGLRTGELYSQNRVTKVAAQVAGVPRGQPVPAAAPVGVAVNGIIVN